MDVPGVDARSAVKLSFQELDETRTRTVLDTWTGAFRQRDRPPLGAEAWTSIHRRDDLARGSHPTPDPRPG